MTKNRDFGQNRQNRSTSNGCRIAGTHNAFRFFFCLKYSVTIVEQKKTPYGRFPMAAILSKNSQVTMAKWSQEMLVPEGYKP